MCGKHWFHEEHFGDSRPKAAAAVEKLRLARSIGSTMSVIKKAVDDLTGDWSEPVRLPTWLPTPPKFTSTEEADAWLEEQARSTRIAGQELDKVAMDYESTVVVAGNQAQARKWLHENGIGKGAIIVTGHTGTKPLLGIRSATIYYVGTWAEEMSVAQTDDLYNALRTVECRHFTEDGHAVNHPVGRARI